MFSSPQLDQESIMEANATAVHREPWNKGKIVGQKAPFKLKDIWALRVRLQMANRVRELALFDLGIDSKLRGCDLVKLRVRDICHGDQVASRAIVMQQKTQRPVQFEITPPTREAVQKWIKHTGLRSEDFLFPSRIHESPHLGTRQYARILEGWVEELGLDPSAYGTHSIRRTKATLIYRRTKNLRAVQLLLGHTKLDYLLRRPMSRLLAFGGICRYATRPALDIGMLSHGQYRPQGEHLGTIIRERRRDRGPRCRPCL
jgi:integrase